jgi:hypothetical protein
MSSSGPLTHVFVGNELSCQIAYTGDSSFEIFPSSAKPGDCGTILFAANVLYAPNFSAHGSGGGATAAGSLGPRTPYTPVSQTPVSGTGGRGDPLRVTTVADAGTTGLRLTQIDSYTIGDESYRTDITVANQGGAAQEAILYRAGDCYLQGSDRGFGFQDPGASAVGCSTNANNSPPARIEQWLPITAGNTYLEARYGDVWAAIGAHGPFSNTCLCDTSVDQGAGLAWRVTIPPGGSVTRSHYTTFSPRGMAGLPPSARPPGTTPPGDGGSSGPLPPAIGPRGPVQLPSPKKCVSKRRFRIHLRNRRGFRIEQAIVFVNNRRVASIRETGRFVSKVDLRGLPKGTFVVRLVVIDTAGRIVRGKRVYHTCVRGKRGRRRPPRL